MPRGSCLCGAVRFEVAGLDDPLACHCGQCLKQSGHVFAAARARKDAVVFDADETLRWYRASGEAARGFCGACGATLFWRADEGDSIRVALGSLEAPTGLRLGRHVWVEAKGDYYDIADGVREERGEP